MYLAKTDEEKRIYIFNEWKKGTIILNKSLSSLLKNIYSVEKYLLNLKHQSKNDHKGRNY